MTFKDAADTDFPGNYKQGLQAIKGNDRNKFDFFTNTRNINGSVDIDFAFKKQMPHENRWDYVVGYNGNAYFFEVHPMTEGEISQKIIPSAQWLEKILSGVAKNINSLKKYPLFWVSTNAGDQLRITPKSKHWKMLEKMHIEWRKKEIFSTFQSS